jgi:glycerol-3-phosphate dehydrogenase
VEKEEDVAMHTSSRNDGMIHPGIASKPGSKRGLYNVRGNKLYSKITKELNVEFKRTGNIILYQKSWMKVVAPLVYKRARDLGVEGVEHISRKQLKELEPNITDLAAGGFSFPTTGVLSPYKLTVAYAENAVMNGAEVSLNTVVNSIVKEEGKIIGVETNRGKILPKIVINAAGVYADKIANMVEDQFFSIHPRKGEIVILDKKKGNLFTRVLAMPSVRQGGSTTKGGGLLRTIEDNILVGPDAYEQPYLEDYSTHSENIKAVLSKHLPLIKGLSSSDVITYFSGIRAATYEEEFIIEKSETVANLIYAAGIQSPGLASAPAIAEDIRNIAVEMLLEYKKVYEKESFDPIRKTIPNMSKLSFEERTKIIKEKPDYGIIVCRCEGISKGEIIDTINSPVPVKTLDGIKRRVRTGMGRCQGGFCTPLVMDIISEELKLDPLDINKKGRESFILTEETKMGTRGENNGEI